MSYIVNSIGKRKMRAGFWILPFVLAMLPIVLLGTYSYRIGTESVQQLVQTKNISMTNNFGMYIQQEIAKSTAILEAFASSQRTAEIIMEDDPLAMTTRLKALKNSMNATVQIFVTDPNGVIEYRYPPVDGSLHQNIRREMNLVREKRKPTFTSVYDTPAKERVFGIIVPIETSGSLIGMVGIEYDTTSLSKWTETLDAPNGSLIALVDDQARFVAGNNKEARIHNVTYKSVNPVAQALQGTLATSEYYDPILATQAIGTFLPINIGRQIWIVIGSQPTHSAYAYLFHIRTNIGLATAMLALMSAGMIVVLATTYRRNALLNEELEGKNQALRETASIVQTSNDAIINFLRDGRIRTWNKAAEKTYGWSPEEMVNQPITKIIPKEKLDEFADILSRVASGETIQNFETERFQKNGVTIPVSLSISPIKDTKGDIVAVTSIDRDITEKRRIDRMKDDIISFVSHQLKAPITAIRWTLEMILDGDCGPLTPELRAPLEEASRINSQNYRLISDMLNISRIDRGVISMEIRETMLSEIVDRALRDYRMAIERAGLKLVVEGVGTSILVVADKEKMAEAISNSLSNAIKHTQKGSITVSMGKNKTEGYVHVSDTGAGMTQDIVQKLFTRTGILGSGADSERSSGLGLYIAKQFMQLQKGDITVSSISGKGTTFTYTIPLSAH